MNRHACVDARRASSGLFGWRNATGVVVAAASAVEKRYMRSSCFLTFAQRWRLGAREATERSKGNSCRPMERCKVTASR